MTDQEQVRAVADELDKEITEYFATLSAAEALQIAGATAHQLEAIAFHPRLNEFSVRLNTRLFSALVRGALTRLAEASEIRPDQGVNAGFAQFMEVQAARYAAVTGVAFGKLEDLDGGGQ